MSLQRKWITQCSLGLLLALLLPLLHGQSVQGALIQELPGDTMAAREQPPAPALAAALPPLLGPDASPQERPMAVTNCTATTCPAAPAGLPHCIQETDFCVYYNSSNNTEAEAQTVADLVLDHWDRYVTDFGFAAPPTPIRVSLINNAACNGAASIGANDMSVNNGCFGTAGAMRQVVGHELFHRFQLGYDFDALWFHEGTARASEDMVYNVLDNWANALTAAFSFNQQVNTYLANPNADLTSDPMRYNSALFWKYFSEQYGSTLTEPEVGIDAFLELWQETVGADNLSALNHALADLGAGVDFETAFRRFAVANWTKDLTGVPDASYNYADEDQAGNPAPYGPLIPASGGTISSGSPATWNNQGVARYGLRYYEADIGATCPLVSVSFHRDSGPAFYHVITQSGSAFRTHVEGSGDDWTQAFLNDGISKVVAIVGSLSTGAQVDLTLECASPSLDVKLPNSGAKAYVQGNTKFIAQVLVTDGSPTGPVVSGLSNADFAAEVNGVNAAVTGGGFVQEQYWLVIRAPSGLASGTYDLEVFVEEPGGSTVIASDTEPSSVEYTSDLLDHVLVIDRSGSMGTPIEPTDDKLIAAKDAADFYVDITRNNDGLAVVAYHHDVSPAPFAMQSVDATVRSDAKDYIDDWNMPNGIYPSGATSIGDGLFEARNQRVASTTGNTRCSFVLLSDGMENSERKWDSGLNPVKADVVATGCPVTSIAFGPASNEILMQTIATDTGGTSFYNDVYVSTAALAATTPATMTLELGSTYEYIHGRREGRQRILQEPGVVSRAIRERTHEALIDETVSEALFALDWYERWWADLQLILVAPDGTVWEHPARPYTFPNPVKHTTHVGWRVRDPEPGVWKLIVRYINSEEQTGIPYQVLVSGRSSLTLHLLLPNWLGARYTTGLRFPIYAVLSERAPIPGAFLMAMVTAPDGSETRVPLYDDGQHGDGHAGDGFYGGLYTRVNQALVVQPPLERGVEQPPSAQDEGAYRVRLLARGAKFRREALGSFAVLEGEDRNQNGLPDAWEKENGVSDPNSDPDLDYLLTGDEYLAGTDPRNSDSDGGGENDGSEVEHGQDPLDPSDDRIEAPEFLQVYPLNRGVLVNYDVKKEYARMELWRAPSRDGPWNLVTAELPRTGVYQDRATNGQRYYYRYIAEDAERTAAPGHRSRVLDSVAVVPSVDPIPPEGVVIINGGALETDDLKVRLSFAPHESGLTDTTASFEDIAEMMLSNSPFFKGAKWQAFAQDVPWTLDAAPGEVAQVYVRFRDKAGNLSVGTEVGMIWYRPQEGHRLYLPLVLNGF